MMNEKHESLSQSNLKTKRWLGLEFRTEETYSDYCESTTKNGNNRHFSKFLLSIFFFEYFGWYIRNFIPYCKCGREKANKYPHINAKRRELTCSFCPRNKCLQSTAAWKPHTYILLVNYMRAHWIIKRLRVPLIESPISFKHSYSHLNFDRLIILPNRINPFLQCPFLFLSIERLVLRCSKIRDKLMNN